MNYLCALLAFWFAVLVLTPHADLHVQYTPPARSSR